MTAGFRSPCCDGCPFIAGSRQLFGDLIGVDPSAVELQLGIGRRLARSAGTAEDDAGTLEQRVRPLGGRNALLLLKCRQILGLILEVTSGDRQTQTTALGDRFAADLLEGFIVLVKLIQEYLRSPTERI